MSDYQGMSHDELIAALRSDMAATSAERDRQQSAAEASERRRQQEAQQREMAESEVAQLEAAAKAAAMPDAQIRAGLEAIRTKFAAVFGVK